MNFIEAINELRKRYKEIIVSETHFLNEVTIEIAKEHVPEVLSYLKNAPFDFDVLMDLTGVDYLEPEPRTKVLYWLHNSSTLERLRITTHIKRNEKLPTVSHLWEGADWYERELFDLFGIACEGHPELKRILLPDDWIGHPLRRDYALTEERVEFKHGVEPKVPSETILYVEAPKPS